MQCCFYFQLLVTKFNLTTLAEVKQRRSLHTLFFFISFSMCISLASWARLLMLTKNKLNIVHYLSNRPQVSMVYKLINHVGCWQNTRRICKPRAAGEWFTNSSSGLSAYKPQKLVVYCLYTIIQKTHDFPWVYRHNNPQLIDQSEHAH